MKLNEELQQELLQEAQTTRRVLKRVPESQLNWRPHEKSMTLGQLAVYLRQVGALVPSVYGPSADEQPFFWN